MCRPKIAFDSFVVLAFDSRGVNAFDPFVAIAFDSSLLKASESSMMMPFRFFDDQQISAPLLQSIRSLRDLMSITCLLLQLRLVVNPFVSSPHILHSASVLILSIISNLHKSA